jgi:hypothetical protein
LDRGDDTGQNIALADGGGEKTSERPVSGAAEAREETPVVEEVGAKSFRNREHVLSVGNVIEEILFEPVAPEKEPFRVARRTEVTALAAEGDEKLRATALAVHAREAIFENPTVEKLPHYLGDTAMQRSVEFAKSLLVHLEKPLVVILEQTIQGRRFGTPGTVDAAG